MAPIVKVQGEKGQDRKGPGQSPWRLGAGSLDKEEEAAWRLRTGRCRRCCCSLHSSPTPAASPVLGPQARLPVAPQPRPSGGGTRPTPGPPRPRPPAEGPGPGRAAVSTAGGRRTHLVGLPAATERRRRCPGQARSPACRSGPPRSL